MTTATTFDVLSIGYLAGELQVLTTVILEVADELGIEPAGRINNVLHFSRTDAAAIADRIAVLRTERRSVNV